VRDGGRQIEYEDQDPRIDALYRAELAKHGVESKMDKYVKPTRPAALRA
jgi:hypothetical protein